MKLLKPISIEELLGIMGVEATVRGNQTQMVLGINELHSVEDGDLSFVDCDKYYDRMLRSKASIIDRKSVV